MDILTAKQAVIAAGNRLVAQGLIARTWGNVSMRIDDESCVVTPSGKAYDSLTPDDIVHMKLADCSYTGELKPSAEKAIHAQAYLLRPEVNFVIHTHQLYASILSVTGEAIPVAEQWQGVLGESIPMANYGLPGQKSLTEAVVAAWRNNPSCKAVILKHHGAIVVGTDAEDTFHMADVLEQQCLAHIKQVAKEKLGGSFETLDDIHAKLAKHRGEDTAPELAAYTSVRDGDGFIMTDTTGEETKVSLHTPADEPPTAALHRAIYCTNKNVNAIVHSHKADILRVSQSDERPGGPKKLSRKIGLLPYLDDFAQIAGVNLRHAQMHPGSVRTALGNRSAVLLLGNGALCVGSNLDEARAVEMVVDKNCATCLSANLFPNVGIISKLHCVVMRKVYVLKYSKKK